MTKLCIKANHLQSLTQFNAGKKINMLFAGLGSVRMVKNCDLGRENAALGLRRRAAFLSPRSQVFTIRTSQPANNIYIFREILTSNQRKQNL